MLTDHPWDTQSPEGGSHCGRLPDNYWNIIISIVINGAMHTAGDPQATIAVAVLKITCMLFL